MRLIICCVVVLSLVLCAGCAKQEPAPAEQAPTEQAPAVDEEPIASEDFESGEAEGVVTGDEAAEEEEPGGAGH